MVRAVSEIYRKSMRRHRFGYALYEPVPFSRLYPGVLGYLDEYQRWHPILDLNDAHAVQAAGYTPLLGNLQRAKPDMRCYGPLTASDVSKTDVALGVGADASTMGLPLDVGGIVSYGTAGSFGAVLVCDGDVASEGFDFRNPFLAWLKRNANMLFSNYPDTKKYGVCIATWTYSTTNIHISAWEGASHSVTVGFTVGAAGVGHATPQTTWHRGHASNGWSTYTDQKRVVFFAGVKIKTGVFGTKEQPESRWRGNDRFMVEGASEDDYYVAEAELIGDDWYIIKDG
ncbi:hypothetical protein NUW58_g7602 [Xylaria curta]|uniref:Uncharacterized protein n=1 Tax=Xylaria curta TaxID=42375 RepID=A0ACC1NHV6_9PEZI|nr:hypothetical protein NUW58_g7602 [Xylaria curta]